MIDWQDIETAPRVRNRPILLAIPIGGRKNVHWKYLVSYWLHADPEIDMDAGWTGDRADEATHWAEVQPPHRFQRRRK